MSADTAASAPSSTTAIGGLGDHQASVSVPNSGHWWSRLLAFLGPGYMVSVGYMDPGNWATDLAGGSQFGYLLLSVILLSNLMAIVLQGLSARLGIATGLDLAQACRARYPRGVNLALWGICELAIIACDLAEVIGTAIALKLLFGIPLTMGAIITAVDVVLVLLLMNRGFRALEAFVIALLLIIFACFGIQIALAAPPIAAVLGGFIPRAQVVTDPQALYLAIGIIGATVMPHNLYLHSSIVQTRAYPRTDVGRKSALRWAVTDSTVALMFALSRGRTALAVEERGERGNRGFADMVFDALRVATRGGFIDAQRKQEALHDLVALPAGCGQRLTGRGQEHPTVGPLHDPTIAH